MDDIVFCRKMTSASADQIKMLLNFMKEHPDLSTNRLLRNSEGRHRAKELWMNITRQLNTMGRSVKTVAQWQKVWTDRKYMAKKAAAATRRSSLGLGSSLSEEHETIRKIVTDSFEPPTKDPLVNVKTEDSVMVYVEVPEAENQSDQNTQDDTKDTPIITEERKKRPTAIPTRYQRRRYRRCEHQETDFCSLLQDLEDQKRSELTLIRQGIGELNSTLKDLVEEFRHIRERL